VWSAEKRAEGWSTCTPSRVHIPGRIVGQPVVGGGCVDEDHPNPAGHESLDVTLAYLKGKDAESEEA